MTTIRDALETLFNAQRSRVEAMAETMRVLREKAAEHGIDLGDDKTLKEAEELLKSHPPVVGKDK